MRPLRVAACLVLAACYSTTPPRPVSTIVKVQPPGPLTASPSLDGTAGPPSAPQQAGAEARLAEAPSRRIDLDTPAGSPVGDVARKLASQFGLDVSVDADVRGTVGAIHLLGATLDEALREVVGRLGLAYQVQGTTLRVIPVRFETRIFALDYVAIARFGSASTVIQRRLGNNASSSQPVAGNATGLSTFTSGAGAFGVPGGDVISSNSIADVWSEVRVALVGLLSRSQGTTAAEATATGASQTQPAPGAAVGAPSNTTTQRNAPTTSTGQTASSGGTAVPTPGGVPQSGLTAGAFSTSWPDGTALTISPMSGLITVTAPPARVAEIQTYLDAFQSSVLRQVIIQAKIVEVQLTRSYEQGIDWSVITKSGTSLGVTLRSDSSVVSSGSASGVNFSFTGGSTQIAAVLKLLETQGTVNVLSQPQTVALNNQRATFDVTTDEVFFTTTRTPVLGANGGAIAFNDQIQAQQISIGIVLDVLPQISSENTVTMNIRPVITSLDRVETFSTADGSSARFPVTARREGDTMLRARNGETIVMGGLMQTQRNRDVQGIPILMNLPLVGRLFRHVQETEKKVELVVFLTPTVLAGQPPAGAPR